MCSYYCIPLDILETKLFVSIVSNSVSLEWIYWTHGFTPRLEKVFHMNCYVKFVCYYYSAAYQLVDILANVQDE